MNKLIVILAVLAFASIAQAAPSWNLNVNGRNTTGYCVSPGDVVTVSLTADSITGMTITGGTITLRELCGVIGPIDSVAILPAIFGNAPTTSGGTLTMGTYVFSEDATANYQSGDPILSITFTVVQPSGCLDVVSALNYAQGSAPAPFPSAWLMCPEPMTLGLFAIGGLFLRRRR